VDFRVERLELTSRHAESVQRDHHCQVQGKGLLLFAVNVKALVGAGVKDEANGISEKSSTWH